MRAAPSTECMTVAQLLIHFAVGCLHAFPHLCLVIDVAIANKHLPFYLWEVHAGVRFF